MRIRHLLIAGIALAFALVAARLVVLEVRAAQGERLDRFQLDVGRVSRDAASLLVLSQDYLLHHSPRAGRQWHAVHAELARSLPQLSGELPEMQRYVDALGGVAQGLPAVFDTLESAAGAADRAAVQPRLEMLADHLVAETRRISDGAFDLAERLGDVRRARALTDRRVTIASMAAFATLTLAISFVGVRRVLRPIAGLEAAAQAMRSGALGARSAYRGRDELGNLSRAFDTMAEKLEEHTASLETSRSLLARTGRLAGVGGWMVDLGSGVVEWSDQTCLLHDVPPGHRPSLDEAVGFYAPEARPTIAHAVEQAMATGGGWDLELPLITATGRRLWVRVIGEVEMAHGKPARLVGAFQDVSARRALEAALRQQNEVVSSVLENLPCGLSVFNAELELVASNSAYRRLLDFPDTLFRDRMPRFEDFIRYNAQRGEYGNGDVESVVREIVERARAPAVAHRFERTRPNGVPLEIRGAPMPGGGFVTTYSDISERKRAEQVLQVRERLLQLVLDSVPGPVAHWDADLRCTVANHACREWLGLDPQQMVGRTHRELLGADATELNAPHLRAALRGEAQRLERSRVIPDGRTRHYVLQYVPDRDADEVRGFISVVMDVTELKGIQHQLELRTRQAEHANLAKSRFLANMSHEIRTPMNAVIGLSYLLGQTALDSQQADFLAKIGLSSKTLLALINDVLDVSKIEAGELMIERAPFDLRGLLHDLADVMQIQAQAKGIGFEIDAPDDLPSALEGDATRLQQILTNLASNAIKFTAHGGVGVRVRRLAATTPQGVRLGFAVRDSGIGIEPRLQHRLFEPFAQADASTTRRFGGTGLGLSIVKQLCERMGGSVSLTSSPGAGSEFCVELEFARGAADARAPSASAVPPAGQRSLAGLRVLVADDSEINLFVARHILELEGAQVTVVGNGEEAYQELRAGPEAFDVVLMDVQMPVLDGYKATRCNRKDLGLKRLPIIALTAAALVSERRRAMVSGMNDFITKPFDPPALVRCILHHVTPHAQASATSPPRGCETQASDAAAWPQIDGIDAAEASARLSGDAALFRSMLGRLLKEFTDVGMPAGASGAESLAACGARMHKLRGSAGMLGAKTIQQLAAAAEAACRGGEAARAAELAAQVMASLQALRASAAPALAEAPAPGAEAGHDVADASTDPQVLHDLVGLLRENDLSALDRFSAASAQLRRRLGSKETYDAVRANVENLQFSEAARTLEALLV